MKASARVAVLGLGDFGFHFASELHQLGHDVLAVDTNEDRVQAILPFVTKAAVADVNDRPALEELGIAGFDIVVICVGAHLETAVLLVHHLRRMKAEHILVKVVNAEQAEIVKLMGATEVIHPDQSMARKAALLIHHPRTVDYLELGGGHLVVACRPPENMLGRMAGELKLEERYQVSLLGLWAAGDKGPARAAHPDRVIREDDLLLLAGHLTRLREMRRVK